jgi:hypothetical protein
MKTKLLIPALFTAMFAAMPAIASSSSLQNFVGTYEITSCQMISDGQGLQAPPSGMILSATLNSTGFLIVAPQDGTVPKGTQNPSFDIQDTSGQAQTKIDKPSIEGFAKACIKTVATGTVTSTSLQYTRDMYNGMSSWIFFCDNYVPSSSYDVSLTADPQNPNSFNYHIKSTDGPSSQNFDFEMQCMLSKTVL